MLRTTFVSRPVKTTVPRTHDVLRRVAPLSSILDLSTGILRLPCRIKVLSYTLVLMSILHKQNIFDYVCKYITYHSCMNVNLLNSQSQNTVWVTGPLEEVNVHLNIYSALKLTWTAVGMRTLNSHARENWHWHWPILKHTRRWLICCRSDFQASVTINICCIHISHSCTWIRSKESLM